MMFIVAEVIQLQISVNNRMRATNHFESSDHLSNLDDNEFLLAPSRLTYSTGKDETIRKLQQKNQRLMTEIQKIERVLNEPAEKTAYGNKLPQINSKATEQQLQNAYKLIKTYEYEINRLRTTTKDGSYVDQVKKCESLLKEKEQMSQKLRKRVAEIKKQSMELTKLLTNDHRRQQLSVTNVKLSNEIKWLRQKLRQMQVKQSMLKDNAERQLNFIKKLQADLLKQGFPAGTLRVLRQKHAPAKQNPSQSFYSNARNTLKTTPHDRTFVESEKEQAIEDRTPEAYATIINEMKLLQKMENDYHNQALLLEKQKEEATAVNLNSRNKLIQIEDEIEKIELRIQQIKKMIDPSKLKPTRGLSLPLTSRYGHSSQGGTNNSAFQHLYRNQEVGRLSKQGRRFADRAKLGKTESKIVSIDLYESKEGEGNIVGIQATYQVKQNLRKGAINMIVDQKQTVKKSIVLIDSQDYFKTIECICSQRGLIIGLALYSNKGVSAKAGCLQGPRKLFNLTRTQYPACLYGSFVQEGLELLGAEVLVEQA